MLKTSPGDTGGTASAGSGVEDEAHAGTPGAASGTAQLPVEALCNSFAEAICVLDEQGRFIDVNDCAAALFGHPRAYFAGRTYATITAAGVNDLTALVRRFRKALAGEPQSFEFRGVHAGGEQIPRTLRLSPVTCNGRPAVIAVASRATRQQPADVQVVRLNRLYAVLNATYELLLRCHDIQTLFNEACRIAVQTGGFRMAWIGQVDRHSDTITPVAHSGQAGDYLAHLQVLRTSGARGNGPTGQALREGNYKVCNDIANDPRMVPWRTHAARMGFRASAAFPLCVAGETRAVLSLYSASTGYFNSEEVGLLKRLAQNISFALGTIEAESRRLATEEMLLIKERALSTSINGIAMASLGSALTYVNQAFLDLWGYQDENEVLGRSLLEFWDSPDAADRMFRELFNQGFIRGDLIGKRRDGTAFITQLSANLVTDQHGIPICLQGAFIDVSEHRSNEEKMRWDREQQTTLRALLEVVLKGGALEETLDCCLKQLFEVSWLSILPQGGILLMEENRQFLRMAVSRDLAEEIISLCAQVPLGKCHCGRAAQTGQIQYSCCVDAGHEITFPGMADHGHYNMPLTSDGEVLGVMVLYLPPGFRNDPLKEQFLSSVADILAGFIRRKRHEESLRLSAAVIKSTHEAIMITDLNRNILSINPSFTEITGYTNADVLGQTPLLLKSQRHDASFYRRMWESIGLHGYWQGEIWNRRKSGELYPEWLTLSAVRDEKGEIVNYVGVFSDISQIKHAEKQLERLAHFDALTDLPNRLLLQSRLDHAIEQARRNRQMVGVLFADLDRFKDVNDSLGHTAGDELLQTVVRRLQNRLRNVDTLARLGGDEFVIVLESLKDAKDAVNVARTLIGLISEPIDLSNGREVYIGASVGISIYPDDGTTSEQLIRNADTAMYQAKHNNCGSFHLYTEAMTQRIEERLQLEARLRRALSQNEFVLHYQPLVSVDDSRCMGVEALVRWNDPLEEDLVLPGRFIALAEETGLTLPLGDWVLHSACAQMKAWLDAGVPLETLAVNLSPTQFKQQDIHATIAACLAETRLPPACLELEITEGAIMEHGPEAVAKLTELKRLGVRLVIDDFGTGYSSLAYLKYFPIDKLKIDKSFIRDIATSPAAAEIASIIIAMAKTLKLESLAEGVETEEQLQFLKSRGCDSCQGFLFSRPVPPAAIPQFLSRKPGN